MSAAPAEDAAWVLIETPLAPDRLAAFIEDVERLFRINSLLEIHRWEQTGPDRVIFEALNLSNGMPLSSELRVERTAEGLRVSYRGLLKRSTAFHVEPSATGGSALRVTDDYSDTPEAERRQRLDEVDRSLPQWGRDLHDYLRLWHRWSWLAPWRGYMQRVWLPMKPAARRITRWLLWITLGELALVLLLVAILAIEQAG